VTTDDDSSISPINATIVISWAVGFKTTACAFARENRLPIINELNDWRGLRFHLDATGWSIIDGRSPKEDAFVLQLAPKRLAQGRDPLLKALGSAKSVLDMTAGWGGDALHIAQSGRAVWSVERHPVVSKLLAQAHEVLHNDLQCRLNFVQSNAAVRSFPKELLGKLKRETNFDLVYLDPMFQAKPSKNAKAKKPMRILQRLMEEPSVQNEQGLFDNAMQLAQHRVVVKRGLKAPYITNLKPQGSIKSKLLRFDLYRP
jgi:16S rRNA G966 N2-methylase RsmD